MRQPKGKECSRECQPLGLVWEEQFRPKDSRYSGFVLGDVYVYRARPVWLLRSGGSSLLVVRIYKSTLYSLR